MIEIIRHYESLAAYQRAIKKQVRAQTFRVLAVCTPGFETVLAQELVALGVSLDQQTAILGGIEWVTSLSALFDACLRLGTANRLWLRLAEFRAGASEELFAKSLAIPWELWFDQKTPVMIRSTVRYSRLSHEGRVSQTIEQAIRRRFEAVSGPTALDQADPALLLVQVNHNHVQISLDASGAPHFQRGYRVAGGRQRAGLRVFLIVWTDDVFP